MPAPAIDNSFFPMGLHEFSLFRSLIHKRTGIWLRDGKQVMLASRLLRRLRHHGLASFADYYSFVQNVQDNGEEIRELINCVTTNKTSFFRERHHFDFLANTVVPAIQSASPRGASRKLIRSQLPCLRCCSHMAAPIARRPHAMELRAPAFRNSPFPPSPGRLR